MAHSVLIAAPDQTTTYELRALVGEIDDFTVVDVVESSTTLSDAIVQRDPEIVLIHEQLGPAPVPQLIREITARRPGVALILMSEEFSPDVFSAAMDAGARGVLRYPTSLEDLSTRLTATAEWVTQMRRHLSSDASDNDGATRGRLVAVAGAKGGVGTTTLAVHLAHLAVTRVAGRSVCVVDLNLDNGDLADFLGISHRLDISDLAKVADDLSAQTIGSAIHRGPTGLATLIGPARIEDVGEVGDRETVLILAALRRQFDLVIADCGSSVTPASAAAVETADEVLLVATPDVLALRGVHHVTDSWKRLGARSIENVKIVLNEVSRDSDIQPDTAARLLPSAPLDTWLPASQKSLQHGLNHQDPEFVRAPAWWSRIQILAAELGVLPAGALKAADDTPRWSLIKPRTDKPRKTKKSGKETVAESGQATLEFVGIFPLVVFIVIVLWQVGLWGVSAAYAGHAADEAARAAGIGMTEREVREQALDVVPGWFRGGMRVDVNHGQDIVKVRSNLPILFPSVSINGLDYTSEVRIIAEDDQ